MAIAKLHHNDDQGTNHAAEDACADEDLQVGEAQTVEETRIKIHIVEAEAEAEQQRAPLEPLAIASNQTTVVASIAFHAKKDDPQKCGKVASEPQDVCGKRRDAQLAMTSEHD